MKAYLMISMAAALGLSACNTNNSSKSDVVSDTAKSEVTSQTTPEPQSTASINEVLFHYLELKNALANDNGNEAATHGKAVITAIDNLGNASLTPEQKKIYDDAAIDAKEMAEHIGSNGDKIAHQREHFEMLSKDMYDLVKVFKADKPLYKDFCPMYNDNKGAAWISETKEIKNPYLGKKMATCGTVKEELK